MFEPRWIQQQTTRKNLTSYSIIPEFSEPNNQLIQEWRIYCNKNEILKKILIWKNIG